jgi:transposase InsO family protein
MSKKYDKEQIGEIVKKIKELKMNYADGAKEFNIPVRHIYRYNNEMGEKNNLSADDNRQAKGLEGIRANHDKEEKAKVEVSSLPSDIQSIIINYRKENPDHGYQRIEDYLQDRYFIKVRRKEIRKILKAHGLEKILDSSFDREEKPAKGRRRFEASCPKELYQMDISYVYISGLQVFYLILIIDDYSRFCIGYDLVTDQKGLTMINALHRGIERYGRPLKLLTDQGGCFYSWGFELTIFQKYLDDMKIEHIVSDPHSPQTQGKVERMMQTIQKELLHKVRFRSYDHAQSEIEAYIHRYNYNRPHQGIGGLCPSDRFHHISAETSDIEKSLLSSSLDSSKGYLILKDTTCTLSVVFTGKTMQVYLDGKLLK